MALSVKSRYGFKTKNKDNGNKYDNKKSTTFGNDAQGLSVSGATLDNRTTVENTKVEPAPTVSKKRRPLLISLVRKRNHVVASGKKATAESFLPCDLNKLQQFNSIKEYPKGTFDLIKSISIERREVEPTPAPVASLADEETNLNQIHLEDINTSDEEEGMPLFVKSDAGTVALPQLPKSQPSVVQTYQDAKDPDVITGYFPGLPSLNPDDKLEYSADNLPPHYVRSTLEDIERLPAIHPSVWASKREKWVDYRGFVRAPPTRESRPITGATGPREKINSTALRRVSAFKKEEDVPEECWRCALHLEHVKCETSKYIRIGGGFRHSYWFVRQLIEEQRAEEERRLAIIRAEQKKIFSEKLAWRTGADGKRERRIKTFIRTNSGRKIEKYQYISEDLYEEMQAMEAAGDRASESAKRRLKEKLAESMGLKPEDADMLDNWDTQSVGADVVAVDDEGNPLVDEFGNPIDATDTARVERAVRRRQRRKEGLPSDDESERADSGLAFSDNEARRRRRRKDGFGSEDEESEYDESGKKVRKKKGTGEGGADDSDEGSFDEATGVRKKKTKGKTAGSDYGSEESDGAGGTKKKGKKGGRADGSDYGTGESEDDGTGTKKKKKKGKGGAGDDDDDDSEEDDGTGTKKKKKKKKGVDGETEDDSDDDDGDGTKGKKKKKKKGGGEDGESESEEEIGPDGKKKKKKKKKGADGETEDDSDDDETDGGGRKKKGKKNKGKGGDGGSDYSDDEDGGGGGRKKKGRRGGRHRHSSSEYSEEIDEDGNVVKKKKHRSRRHRDDDDSDYSDDDGGGGKKGSRRRRDRRRRDYSDSDSGSDRSGGGRRKHRKHRKHRGEGEDGESGSDYSDDSRRSGRKHKKHRRHRDRDGDGSDYSGSDSGSDRSRRRRRKKDRKHRRRRGSYSDDSVSSKSEYDEDGNKVKKKKKHRHRRRREGEEGEDYSDRSYSDDYSSDDSRRRRRRRKKEKKRRHRRHDSDYSDYSDDGSQPRRRHRRRHRSYDSDESSFDSGADAESKRGKKGRRRRRRRSSDYSYSEHSDDSQGGEGKKHRRRRRRHRSSDYSDDYDSRDGSRAGSRRRRRRHRRRSYSSDSEYDSRDDGEGGKKKKHRKHRRRSYSSDSDSDRSRRRGKRGKKGRRHRRRSYSSSYSDDSDDSRRSRRKKHRSRRHRGDSSSYSDDSDDSRGGRRRKDKKKKHRRRYSTSTDDSSAGDEKSRRKKDKRRDRRRGRYYSDSDSDSDGSDRSRRHKKKKRRPPRPPSSDSSDLSSEASEGRLNKMSKEEKRKYEKRRRDKMRRKEERAEQREIYEEYKAKEARRKERRKKREEGFDVSSSSSDDSWGDGKTAVKYGKGSRRGKKGKDDNRDIGYDDPNDPWAKKEKKEKRRKERRAERKELGLSTGSDTVSSSDENDDFFTRKEKREKREKQKKTRERQLKGEASDSEESLYEDVFEEDGTVQRRKIKVPKKKSTRVYRDDELDAESEYDSVGSADIDAMIGRQIYDADGEIIRLTKDGRRIKDGKISKEVFDIEKHKQRKAKKAKDKQMMGQGYEEEYIEEFVDDEGNVVRVKKKRLKDRGGKGKRPTTPLVGPRRVAVLFKKGGRSMQERLDKLLAECILNDHDPRQKLPEGEDGTGVNDIDESDGMIDYLTHYRLVNPANLEGYGKAFLVEDTDKNYTLNLSEANIALEGIPALKDINDKQKNYILKILGIDDASIITFKMFAVIAALCERLLSVLDEQTRQWMEINDLVDMERKVGLYRNMFYWNTCSDRSKNYIKATALRIELIAGGLSRVQEDYVMEKIEQNIYREVSFIDYMAFIPLFLSTHETIVDNPLDMSRDKFTNTKVLEPQRDLVPVGQRMTTLAASGEIKQIPIPYKFEKRPGSSLRKRIRLTIPKPPEPEPEKRRDSLDSLDSLDFPIPSKMKKTTQTKT